MRHRIRALTLHLALCLAWLATPSGVMAASPDDGVPQGVPSIAHPSLQVAPLSRTYTEVERALDTTAKGHLENAWVSYQDISPQAHQSIVFIDTRSGRPSVVTTGGIPWIPGDGNALTLEDIAEYTSGGDVGVPTLDTMESLARAFIDRHGDLLGVTNEELVLHRSASGASGPQQVAKGAGARNWRVDFLWTPHGRVVEKAHLLFRVNSGNLVQFGMEFIGDAEDVPEDPVLGTDEAMAILANQMPGLSEPEKHLGRGTLKIYPADSGQSEFGRGYAYRLAWTYTFEAPSGGGHWQGAVDAHTGELLLLRSQDPSACAAGQVRGGVRVDGLTADPEQSLGLPFADYGAGTFADGEGCFPTASGTSTLGGEFFDSSDQCGTINISGALDFGIGTPGTTNCNSPVAGSDGNTTAARTAYYYLNQMRSSVKDHYPCPGGSCWFTQPVPVRTNMVGSNCNAFFREGSGQLEFHQAGTNSTGTTECFNPGEVESLIYHEYGHAIDSRGDGNGLSPDLGSAEGYADIMAFFQERDACIARGILKDTSPNACGADGNGSYVCSASCNGFREADWQAHQGGTPRNTLSSSLVCPVGNAAGPCGRQSHCEGNVASQAVWDLAERDLESFSGLSDAGAWATAEDLWYEATQSTTGLFTCSGVNDGAGMGTLYSALMAADDCNGNLLDGTPNASAIFAALNRHGIASGSASSAQNQSRGCGSQMIGEVGAVTNLTHVPQTILFNRTYSNPVVVAQPPSFNGPNQSVVRITDVSTDRFTLFVDEAPNHDGLHTTETVSYLVLEAGSWQLADGRRLEVGKVDTASTVGFNIANSWESIVFDNALTGTPVVMTQVQTENDPTWVKTRQMGASSTGFQVALEQANAGGVHGTETIGWVALTPGTGTWSGHPYAAGNTPNAVTHEWYTLAFGTSLGANPRFLAALSTYDGGHHSALRYQNLNATGAEVKVEEDTTDPAINTAHTTEVVSYLGLGGDGDLDAAPLGSGTQILTTQTFVTVADAWVDQASPSTNHGSDAFLEARATTSGQGKSAYLKFSVSGVTGPVHSAWLRVKTRGTDFPSMRLYHITSSSWSENTITWNNAPLAFSTQYPVGAKKANAWHDIDVSGIIQGNGTYTLGLTAEDDPNLSIWSREWFNSEPRLVIVHE